jgi:GNAT superfamily N-acetyltransferase
LVHDLFANPLTLWRIMRVPRPSSMRRIESRSESDTELRRMYLDKSYRGLGIAQRMFDCAQTTARQRGFTKMIVSTAQIQEAADRFYRRNGFRQIRTEVAEVMTAKQAGGGLTRFHFEKAL